MPISPKCPHCGKKHRLESSRISCALKAKIYGNIIEMEECPHCKAYQEEPATNELFKCPSCKGVAV